MKGGLFAFYPLATVNGLIVNNVCFKQSLSFCIIVDLFLFVGRRIKRSRESRWPHPATRGMP